MKTGEVAQRFRIDPKTVRSWVAEYAEFFSTSARAEEAGQLQAEFKPEDLVVINTIRIERGKKVDKEAIRAKLAAGERNADLPPELTNIEGNNAIVVYTQLKALEVRIEELQNRLEASEAERLELRQQMETEKNELHKQIRRLERENAVLQFRLGEFSSDEDA